MSGFAPEEVRRGPLASALQKAGYRLTTPRLAVLAVLEAGACHASPNEVYDLGRAMYPELGLSTVYRTLDILTALGLVRPTYLGDAAQRFTLHHDRQHHHLVCEDCGEITDVEEEGLAEVTTQIASRLGFQPHGHYLEIYGLCRRCQGKN